MCYPQPISSPLRQRMDVGVGGGNKLCVFCIIFKQPCIMERNPTVFSYCPRDGRQFKEDEQICPLCSFQRVIEKDLSSHATWTQPAHKPPWSKLLYVKQDYPDNYVDDTFLEELQKNANVRHYEYWPVVLESTIFTQHFSSIVIFVAVFVYLYQKHLSAHVLIAFGGAGTTLGYIFFEWSSSKYMPTLCYQRHRIFKGAAFFFLALLGLTPILKTLTLPTSWDTICSLAVVLFLANLAFHDYGSDIKFSIKYPESLSINAAIFASVVLASRCEMNVQVFGLVAFAVEWFALFPMLRRHVRSVSVHGSLALTFVLFITATTLFLPISSTIAAIYVLGTVFVTFVCPFWLIWLQRYKNEIQGPWDEACPKIQPNH